jgi:hypothetical protein
MEPLENPDHFQAHLEHDNNEDELQLPAWKEMGNPCDAPVHRESRYLKAEVCS